MADRSSQPVENLILRHALALAEAGYLVFPCRQLDKRPATGNGLLDASSDPVVVRRWFGAGRDLNLAVACGLQPNGTNLLAVDIDPTKGGFESWNALVDQHDPLPLGPTHMTRSGGQHRFFDAPEDLRNTAGRLGPGIDTRGQGGYVVVPPSKVVDHDTGEIGHYTSSKASSLVTVPVPMLPAWLCRLLVEPIEASVARHPSMSTDRDGPYDRVRRAWQGWEDELLRDGWSVARRSGGDVYFTRPGKNPRDGHSAVLHPSGAFVVFTTERPWGGGAIAGADGVTFSPGEYVRAYRFGGDMQALLRAYPAVPASAGGADRDLGSGGRAAAPAPDGDGTPPLNLPDDFWGQRPVLAHIRQAAWSAGCSPDALLVHTLARVATFVHPSFKLPGVEQGLIGKQQTLDFLGCVVAETSGGKTLAAGVGELLVPAPEPPLDGTEPLIDFEQKVGSGEGIAEFFLVPELAPDEDGKLKPTGKRTIGKQALFMSVDEGTGFTAQAGRKGTTIIATLASAWSGESLGQLNAAEQTRRLVRGGRVRICAVINMQDTNGYKLYSDDLESVGFTGRLMFASAHDPSAPPPSEQPEWPGPLSWPIRGGSVMGSTFFTYDASIVDEIKATRHGILTKAVQIDRRQSQYLLLRCKVAALFAVLDGRLDVSGGDWALATQAIEMSAAVLGHLDHVHGSQIESTAVQAATFKLRVAEKADTQHIKVMKVTWQARLIDRLQKKGPLPWKGLKDIVDGDRRKELREALNALVDEGAVILDGSTYRTVR